MDNLPEEVLLHIFSFCSGYSIFFSRTCRRWFCLNISVSKSAYIDCCFEEGNLNQLKKLTRESTCHEVITSDRVHRAIQRGHLKIVRWVKEQGYIFGVSELCSMATLGKFSMLKWIYSNPRTHHLIKQHGEIISFYLAEADRFEILQWLFSCCFKLHKYCSYQAAKHGNLPMIEWLAQRGCPLTDQTIGGIGQGGQIDILGWVVENRQIDDFNKLLKAAAERGHFDMLLWVEQNLSEKFPLEKWHSELCSYAAESGNLEMLCWLKGKGFRFDEQTCQLAAWKGRFEVVKWLIVRGCPCDENVFFYAVEQGDLSLLPWLRRHHCPWDEEVCSNAAREGRLEVLKWLRRNGCPWNVKTLISAAESGQFETFAWAYHQGCPYDPYEPSVVESALFSGNVKILEFLLEEGFSFDDVTILAEEGNTEVLEWLYTRLPPETFASKEYQKTICQKASERNQLSVLQWAKSKQFEWNEQVTFNLARSDNLIGLRWAVTQGCPINSQMINSFRRDIDPEILFWIDRMSNSHLLGEA